MTPQEQENLPVSIRPWAASAHSHRPEDVNKATAGRPCIVLPAEAAASVEPGHIGLPELGRWRDEQGNGWKALDLPAANVEPDVDPKAVTETLQILVRVPAHPLCRLYITLKEGIPALSGRKTTDDAANEESTDGPVNPWSLASGSVSDVVTRHTGFFQQMSPPRREAVTWRPATSAERPSEDGPTSGNRRQGVQRAPVAAILRSWVPWNTSDNPARSVIVEIARHAKNRIEDVCMRPRRVLSRRRELQPVARAQEMDAACLRWLVRQPGRTVTEKAGNRQQVLAVTRFEDCDTPENRVVKDLLVRSMAACRKYISEYRHYRGHQYLNAVRQLARMIGRLQLASPIAAVAGLVGMPQPNYVLQHDHRYRPLWRYYVRLLKQQKLEDQVWRWRHRIWWEDCSLLLLAALQRLAGDHERGAPLRMSPALRSDVYLHGEPVEGRFLDVSTAVDRWLLPSAAGLKETWFVEGSQWYRFAGCMGLPAGPLAQLCPDGVLASMESHGRSSLVGVWALSEFEIQGVSLEERAAELRHALESGDRESLKGLLLLPKAHGAESDGGKTLDVHEAGPATAIRYTVPATQHLDHVADVLKAILNGKRPLTGQASNVKK